MSQYLILSQVKIQNANSIAGFTWGFPAITHFLGFTHALNRKISANYGGHYDTELDGCAVVVHQHQNKVYQPKQYADFEFLQSKNPPVLAKHKSSSPPIIEEGKLNLTVSLIIALAGPLVLTGEEIVQFERQITDLSYRMRIAGGAVLSIARAKLLSANTEAQQLTMLQKIKRLTMPGFILKDRSEYLAQHYQTLVEQSEKLGNQTPRLLDAWLDFSAMKFKAEPKLDPEQIDPDEKTAADWYYIPKPNTGYLVPLMTGYKAISEVYPPGHVENTRDPDTPACFVEAVHSVGEWQSMHRVTDIELFIWRYHSKGEWYVCQQQSMQVDNAESIGESESDFLKIDDIEQALNLF